MAKSRIKERRPKGKNGQGRQSEIKIIAIPEETYVRLKEIKSAYSKCFNMTVTWEQMLSRWADQLKRIDEDVYNITLSTEEEELPDFSDLGIHELMVKSREEMEEYYKSKE